MSKMEGDWDEEKFVTMVTSEGESMMKFDQNSNQSSHKFSITPNGQSTGQLSPGQGSPSHRSEIRLRLHKQLSLSKVDKLSQRTSECNGEININSHLEPVITITQAPIMNGDVQTDMVTPVDPDINWSNMYESVLHEHLGKDAYAEAMEKQRKIFKSSCQEGTIIKDVGIYLKEEKVRTLTGVRALRMPLRQNQGVGLVGHAIIENNPLLDHDPLFTPGKMIEVTAVHSNYPFSEDDANICTRTMGLKFSLHPSTSPFDLMLHTGDVSPAFTADAVHDYATSILDEASRKKYLLSLPVYMESYIEGVRSAPTSYYHQHYYSHVTYNVKVADGRVLPCRFRVIPADGSAETGRLSPQQQQQPWRIGRSETDNRPLNYLKEELKERVKCGHLEYLLQIQCPSEKQTHICHMHYNPAVPWTNASHRWSTIATVKLTHVLPDEATQLVRYHISHLPACLSLPEVISNEDFNLVPHIMKDACDAVDRVIPVTVNSDRTSTDDDTEYLIYVITSSRPEAGVDTDVTVSMIGTEGRTAFRKLHQAWHHDLNSGRKRTYVLTERPLGDLICLKFYNNTTKVGVGAEWLVEKVVVATPYNGKCYSFPADRWIPPKQVVTLRDGKALLPTMENVPLLRFERQLELQDMKAIYQWNKVNPGDAFYGLPGHLAAADDTKAIPRELLWDGFAASEIEWLNHNKIYASTFRKLKRTLSGYFSYKKTNPVEPYMDLVSDVVGDHPQLDQNMKFWTSDEQFGQLLLNGSNPVTLERITDLPSEFQIEPTDLDPYVENGTFLEGLKAILYASEERNTLLPLAILLQYTPGDTIDSDLFTPSDDMGNPSPWQLAKMWVRCAEVHYHLLDSYLVKTVLMMEAVTIALLRNVSHVHPMYKLLFPHLRHVPALATLWRKVLLPENGALSQVLSVGEHHDDMMETLRRMTSEASLSKLYPPDNLSSRSVLDSSVLPAYHYREDTLRVCGAIKHHCAQVVDHYYADDEEVFLDEELQELLADLRSNGLPGDNELPQRFYNRKELVHFLTTIIFTTTAQANALTGAVVDDMSFVPLSPPTLHMLRLQDNLPKITTNGKDIKKTEDPSQLYLTLPTVHLSASYVSFIKLLGKTKTGKSLGKEPEKNFLDSEVIAAQKNFKWNLEEIEEWIVSRNQNLASPYTSLLPSTIPDILTA